MKLSLVHAFWIIALRVRGGRRATLALWRHRAPLAMFLLILIAFGAAHADVTEGKKLLAAGKAEEAIQVLLPLARQGSAEAQYLLGNHYHWSWNSHGTATKEAALMWYEKSAAQGYPPAQAGLGALLRYGNPPSEQRARSIRLLRAAAEAGNLEGQYFLGVSLSVAHLYGHPKFDEGVAWLEKAAAGKYYSALGNLAMLYFGYWVDKRYHKDLPFFRRAMAIDAVKWLLLDRIFDGDLPVLYAKRTLAESADREEIWMIARHRARKWLDANGHSHIDLPKEPPWGAP